MRCGFPTSPVLGLKRKPGDKAAMDIREMLSGQACCNLEGRRTKPTAVHSYIRPGTAVFTALTFHDIPVKSGIGTLCD